MKTLTSFFVLTLIMTVHGAKEADPATTSTGWREVCFLPVGNFSWTPLPDLPESEGQGRWLGTVGIVPGKWLLLVEGHPTGTPFETRSATTLADWRLRLNVPGAQWEPMASYPGSARALMSSGVIRGKLYVFGGSIADTALREVYLDLVRITDSLLAPIKECMIIGTLIVTIRKRTLGNRFEIFPLA